MDIKDLYDKYRKCAFEVCTDTRSIKKGSMFFALNGANFNGNEFINKALSIGCKYAICDDDSINGENIINVESSLKTLQQLANFHRSKFDIPFLAVTGSNGKTTTKELLAEVLLKKYDLLYTSGNLNNHIGVPLTLLKLRSRHDFALIEMGANKPGDIHELCEIVDPTHGLITNIGVAHIEGFGSKEGVLKTKTELYRYIIKRLGTLFVNNNEEYLIQYTNSYSSVIQFGGSGLNFENEKSKYELELCINGNLVKTKLFGKYNANNVLTAYAVGLNFGVIDKLIKEALEAYTPKNNRSQIKPSKKGNQLILDAYNANPSSLNLAIDELLEKAGKKVFIIGDMKELGSISEKEHKEIIIKLKASGCLTFLVGSEFFKYNTSNIKVYSNVEDLIKDVELKFIRNSQILIKGSRGIQLEKIEPYL
jgi:UDP-N-acetylmuramoyl-tripeptide--D-alanyl-D-alanine ligase